MAEIPISISSLNDFIFCPASIYFHGLDQDTDVLTYQSTDQINGTAAHRTVDSGTYSENKDILQSFAVYSEQYNLYGKIDIYDYDIKGEGEIILTINGDYFIYTYEGLIALVEI